MTIAKKLDNLQSELSKISANLQLSYPIKLIAVSKTFPLESIIELHKQTGQVSFAENYVKEFVLKAESLKSYNFEWHFIGNLQSNKTKDIAKYASWVHSIENERQVSRLNKDRPAKMPPINVLIEVNISGESSKHGLVMLDDVIKLATLISQQDNLVFRGLMGVASDTQDLSIIASQFKQLKNLFDNLIHQGFSIDTLSMGMSGDYVTAIENGSTMIRIGSAIFGHRNYHI